MMSGDSLAALSNNRMYGSMSQLYQRPDTSKLQIHGNYVANGNQSVITTTSTRLMHSSHELPYNYPNGTSNTLDRHANSRIDKSCASTPIKDGSHQIRRKASLGQLDEKLFVNNNEQQNRVPSDRRLGSFQQKIRALLLPSKNTKFKSDTIATRNDTQLTSNAANDCNNLTENRNGAQSSPSMPTLYAGSDGVNETHNEVIAHRIGSAIEDEEHSYNLRDVCNKWYAQTASQTHHFQAVATAVNSLNALRKEESSKMSHNIKPILYDKVVPKDAICENVWNKEENQVSNEQTVRQTDRQTSVKNVCEHRYVEIRRSPNASASQCAPESTHQSAPESAPQTSITPNGSDHHVIVVNCLQSNSSRDTTLTVRPENPSIQLIEDMPTVQCSSYPSNDIDSMRTSVKANQISESVESATLQASNYKSSSESGRGTLRSDVIVKNDSPLAVSPCDLTSLDTDHSNQSNHSNQVLTTSAWIQHNRTQNSCPQIDSSVVDNEVNKMQRDLQRIMEYSSTQSSEQEVEELGKFMQTRLSIVNESDGWISNTSPLPSLPTLPQTSKSAKLAEIKIENKSSKQCASYPVIAGNAKMLNKKSFSKPKQVSSSCDNYAISKPKKYSTSRHSDNQHLINTNVKRIESAKYYHNLKKSTISNLSSNAKRQERLIDIANCDMASTTTIQDSNAEYPDDLSSEYSVDTCLDQTNEILTIRKQLQGLESMYSEIVNMLGQRLKRDTNHRVKRKVCASVSSVTGRSSVTTTRDAYQYRRTRYENKKHKNNDFHNSSERLKQLESHVMTLARSVAYLSSQMQANHSLTQQLQSMRQEMHSIRNQLQSYKHTIQSGPTQSSAQSATQASTPATTTGPHASHGRPNDAHAINAGRAEKLKKFFGDEPPLLRQFLKRLGYEKYARNFESEKIGITELPYLSEEKIQKLGIPLGPRLRILQESLYLAKSNPNDNFNIYGIV